MAKAESSNWRRAVEILPPESGPLPIDITESMVREGVAFLEHHRESLDCESLVARLFKTMMWLRRSTDAHAREKPGSCTVGDQGRLIIIEGRMFTI
jgi:hypothetical protein